MSDDRFPRCKVTGNLCGTDTRPEGEPCQCEPCQTHGAAKPVRVSSDPPLLPCRRYVEQPAVPAEEIERWLREEEQKQ